jgi:hypothetical protein
MSTARTFTIAGANATIDELLQAINDAIVAESTLWEVSQLSIVNHTCELKRKVSGSPTGEYASVRLLYFGGATPNAAALVPSTQTAVSTALYGCLSIDAATTGPGTAFTAGAPYSTKFLQGERVCINTDFVAASSPRITFMESTEGLAIWFHHISASAVVGSCIQGKLFTRASDGADLWCNMPGGGAWQVSAVPNTLLQAGVSFGLPSYTDSAGGQPKGCYFTGNGGAGTVKQFGRRSSIISASQSDMGLGETGLPCTLIPVLMVDSAQAATQTEQFAGYLRQLRLGPIAAHRVQLKDTNAGNAVVAKHLCGSNVAGLGVWFDEVQ